MFHVEEGYAMFRRPTIHLPHAMIWKEVDFMLSIIYLQYKTAYRGKRSTIECPKAAVRR
jgi:hypothetical protein